MKVLAAFMIALAGTLIYTGTVIASIFWWICVAAIVSELPLIYLMTYRTFKSDF